MINLLECVSTAARICGQCAVSIQTRPFFTASFVADGSLTNFGTRGLCGFHFVPAALATSSANRAAMNAGVSVLR